MRAWKKGRCRLAVSVAILDKAVAVKVDAFLVVRLGGKPRVWNMGHGAICAPAEHRIAGFTN